MEKGICLRLELWPPRKCATQISHQGWPYPKGVVSWQSQPWCLQNPLHHLIRGCALPRQTQPKTEHSGEPRAWPFLSRKRLLNGWRVGKAFSELYCSMRFFLAISSFSLSFHRVRTGLKTFPALSGSLSPFYFTGIRPKKSLAFLTPSWYLLPGGHNI